MDIVHPGRQGIVIVCVPRRSFPMGIRERICTLPLTHGARHPASRTCQRALVVKACSWHTLCHLRPILLRQIGWCNTSSSFIRSVAPFIPITASQNTATDFHDLFLMHFTTAGSHGSFQTTKTTADLYSTFIQCILIIIVPDCHTKYLVSN